jgi:chemotaxis protein histidine kinase CheA
MMKICLVNGGDYVLGIDAQYILSRRIDEKTVQTARETGGEIYHLGSLLSRQSCDAVPPDSIALHVQNDEEIFLLLVDRIVDEIEVAEQPSPSPPSCPRLAGQLCPQVTVYENMVVPLLDPARIIPVAEQLGDRVGRVAEPSCLPASEEPEEEVEKKQNTGKEDCGSEPQAAISAEAASESSSASEVQSEAEPVLSEKNGEKKEENASPVDTETFKKVMTWTIAQFKQGKAGGDIRLNANQLPPDLVRREGVSDGVIQYLIDQIALRCQESMKQNGPGEHHDS